MPLEHRFSACAVNSRTPYRFVFKLAMVQNCHFAAHPNKRGRGIRQQRTCQRFEIVPCVCFKRFSASYQENGPTKLSLRVYKWQIYADNFPLQNGSILPYQVQLQLQSPALLGPIKTAVSCLFNRQPPPLSRIRNIFIIGML